MGIALTPEYTIYVTSWAPAPAVAGTEAVGLGGALAGAAAVAGPVSIAFAAFNAIIGALQGPWPQVEANWNALAREYGEYLDKLAAENPDLARMEYLPQNIRDSNLALEGMDEPWMAGEKAALQEQVAAWEKELAEAQARLLENTLVAGASASLPIASPAAAVAGAGITAASVMRTVGAATGLTGAIVATAQRLYQAVTGTGAPARRSVAPVSQIAGANLSPLLIWGALAILGILLLEEAT
jgi:hypothetical protein